MEPDVASVRWFESEPDPIDEDPSMVVLMARVGMASNALQAQFRAARDAGKRPSSPDLEKNCDIVSAFVTTAALIHEAIDLARENMPALRHLVGLMEPRTGLLEEMGRLCGGKHSSSPTLARARNKLGFHWDKATTAASVKEFARNKKIIWLEWDSSAVPVFSFAFAVQSHAMFPGIPETDTNAQRATIEAAMQDVNEAIKVITEFFIASMHGFIRERRIRRRDRKV
jgi:hypothetical protein